MYIGNNFAVKRNTCEVIFGYYANEFDNGLTKLHWLQNMCISKYTYREKWSWIILFDNRKFT